MANTNNTNHIAGVVKILETPKQKNNRKNISFTECRVQLPQARNKRVINLVFWDRLAREVPKYYKINDYILIEGYVALPKKQALRTKKVKITVLKVYPFLLNSNRSMNKT
jgi:hypothetical protein